MLVNSIGATRSARREIFVDASAGKIDVQWVQGIGSGSGGGPAGAIDGDGDQRNFESAIAVAAGAAGSFSGDRGGTAGNTVAAVCGGIVF